MCGSERIGQRYGVKMANAFLTLMALMMISVQCSNLLIPIMMEPADELLKGGR